MSHRAARTATAAHAPLRALIPFATVVVAALGVLASAAPAQQLVVGRLDANAPASAAAFQSAALTTPTGGGGVLPGTALEARQLSGPNQDADGDGLTNAEELAGWDIVIDEHGYGTAALGSLLTILHVTSNPLRADTDLDGLTDYEEWAIGCNPRNQDTDGDLLDDEEEWNTWFTSTNSVDTDGDARGPNHDLAPNVSLFDGFELDDATPRTSPTLDDTDGDGRTDFEEFDHPFLDPLIAELLSLSVDVAGDIDVRLDIEYAEAVITEKAYEVTLTESESTTIGDSDTSSKSTTLGWHAEVTTSHTVSGGVSPLPPWPSGEYSTTVEGTAGTSGDVTKETSFTTSTDSTMSSELSSSTYVSDSQEFTETAASGSITLPVRLVNDGLFSYTLQNLALTILAWKADPTQQTAGSFQAVGTLLPEVGGVTLGPGEVTPILTLSANELNVDAVKSLMANPSTLILQPAYYDLVDENGIDFDFLSENTFTQTAMIEIDYGGGDVDVFRVATNVDRSGFDYKGIRLDTVLTDILGIDYTTEAITIGGSAVTGTDGNGDSVTIHAPASVGGVAWSGDENDVQSFWSVTYDGSLAGTQFSDDGVFPDFETIRLHGGDSVRLIYTQDADDDGLWAFQEELFGTSDTDTDSDDDGLTDLEEVMTGWELYTWTGSEAVGTGTFVYSDPTNPDTDFDGLTDDEEADENTDPQNPDTDGDGQRDGADEDPYPLIPAGRLLVRPDVQGGTADGLTWGTALGLNPAFQAADARNTDTDESNDVSQIWVARGTYTPANDLIFPRGNVSVYGGFEVGDTKLGDRNPDPATNQTAIVEDQTGAGSSILRFADDDLGATDPAGTLDGFLLSSTFDLDEPLENGVYVQDGRARLRNLLFYDNFLEWSALRVGGNASVDVSHCHFQQNESTENGGPAVRVGGLELSRFSDCTFTLNRTHKRGGAVMILDQVADGEGVEQVEPEFVRCTFQSNSVYFPVNSGAFPPVDWGGGAVFTRAGGRFLECDFFGNSTGSDYDAANYKFGKHALRGGAIHYHPDNDDDQSLVIINGRFFDNVSGFGGALFADDLHQNNFHDKHIVVANTTFVRNAARRLITESENDKAGGAVHLSYSEDGPEHKLTYVDMRNCLFWDNMTDGWLSPQQVPDDHKRRAGIRVFGASPVGIVDIWYTTLHGLYDSNSSNFLGNANNDIDPAFQSSLAGNLRLSQGSLAIDAGTNVIDTDPLTLGITPMTPTDLDGEARFVNGDGFGGAEIDRGAYERQP